MRPLRSFLILLIFLVCFTGLHYLVPVSKLFPTINEFVPANLLNSLFSAKKELNLNPVITLPDSAESIPSKLLSSSDTIPENVEDSLFMPLYGLLDSISHSSGQPRIMYYGDSQIEGDRITSFLRKTLRERNSGTGPGLFLPLMPVMYTESIWIRSSSNWKRYNFLSYRSGEISHRALGPFMAICRYLPEGERTTVPEKATVRIRPSKFADSTSSEFDFLRMFYGNTEGVVNVVVKADEEEVFSDTLKRGRGYNEIVCQLKGAREILIEFEGTVSPDIYGISIESKKGVIVDNMPQRGSAGLEFTMVDSANLAESYKKLSPDLFILHYGLNIVKNVRDDYTYYRKGLVKQISLLRKISPLTPVLLIGVTDMATNEGDSIISYRNIPAIIEAQMRAARETGIFFWDSYIAMGGKSSIVAWSDKKAPLSQKDYVHFTNQGADTLSKLLIEARFTPKSLDSGTLNTISANHKQAGLSQPEIIKTNTQIVEEVSFFRSLLSQIFKYDPDDPMIFSTAAFWLFFLIVLAGYSIIYKKLFLRNSYLFLFSLFFYYKSGGLFLLLLIFVTVIDFTCGLLIHRSRTKLTRRIFIVFSIFSNLGILAYFKYTAFIVSSINVMLGTEFKVHDFLAAFSNTHLGTSFNLSNILLPVGISFFTFQSLSYTLDIYRRKMDPVRNIIDFGFYVSFFPQLVAGPIVRASEFIPQLYSEFHLGKREFSHSLFLISKGLIKKIIISDFIAVNFIDRVFDAPSIYSGFENLMAVYGYGLQIYCDFSGYTDIAIGLALILGFRLPANFNSPYKADSISDFWKRWHISLSRWLKDYLYIPLGGNRRGKIRTNINLMITMILGGLWHGASLRFMIWGAIHGVGLVAGSIWRSIFGLKFNAGLIGRLIGIFITFHFVTFCWIFFRAPDLDSAGTMLKQIFENFSPGSYLTVLPAYSNVFLLIVVGYLIHFLPEKIKESYRGLFIRVPLPVQLGFIMLVAILLFQMRTTEVMPFIYFRF